MAKQKSHSASIATRHWRQGYSGPGPWAEHDVRNSSVQGMIRGTDISGRVKKSDGANFVQGNDWRADSGFGAVRSRGTRPVHRAKDVTCAAAFLDICPRPTKKKNYSSAATSLGWDLLFQH